MRKPSFLVLTLLAMSPVLSSADESFVLKTTTLFSERVSADQLGQSEEIILGRERVAAVEAEHELVTQAQLSCNNRRVRVVGDFRVERDWGVPTCGGLVTLDVAANFVCE